MRHKALQTISDTAIWAAALRARESASQNPVFIDPHARLLAGRRGDQILRELPQSTANSWAWIARTSLFDRCILEGVQDGIEMVVNIASGLDCRPYRLDLPQDLIWVEVDLPAVVTRKEKLLRGISPRCEVRRHALDLLDLKERRDKIPRIIESEKRTILISEGFVMYLTSEQVGCMADELANYSSIETWVVDILSEGVRDKLQSTHGAALSLTNNKYHFAPKDRSAFFHAHGWLAKECHSMLQEAARIERLPDSFRPALELERIIGSDFQFWSGVCVLNRYGLPRPRTRRQASSSEKIDSQ